MFFLWRLISILSCSASALSFIWSSCKNFFRRAPNIHFFTTFTTPASLVSPFPSFYFLISISLQTILFFWMASRTPPRWYCWRWWWYFFFSVSGTGRTNYCAIFFGVTCYISFLRSFPSCWSFSGTFRAICRPFLVHHYFTMNWDYFSSWYFSSLASVTKIADRSLNKRRKEKD